MTDDFELPKIYRTLEEIRRALSTNVVVEDEDGGHVEIHNVAEVLQDMFAAIDRNTAAITAAIDRNTAAIGRNTTAIDHNTTAIDRNTAAITALRDAEIEMLLEIIAAIDRNTLAILGPTYRDGDGDVAGDNRRN